MTDALRQEQELRTHIAEDSVTEFIRYVVEHYGADTSTWEAIQRKRRRTHTDGGIADLFLDMTFEEYLRCLREEVKEEVKAEIKEETAKRKSTSLSVMFSGKGINALARVKPTGIFNPLTKAILVDDVSIFLPDSVKKIGVGTAKIFRYAVAEFAKHNSQNTDSQHIKYSVTFDVKDFAEANGVDTTSDNTMKQFRLKLKKDLDTLKQAKAYFLYKTPKGYEHTVEAYYFGATDTSTDDNFWRIEFTVSMAQYLVTLPLIQYPRTLYRLNNKETNAFVIGEAMCIHYSQENNVISKTENKLKVSTLLKYTSYPTQEELKTHRWSWKTLVKEPFETALDKLTQCGFLADWTYCKDGGEELTDEEAAEIIDKGYGYFASLLVRFKLNDYPTHQARAVSIAKKRAEKERLENIKKGKNRRAKKMETTS